MTHDSATLAVEADLRRPDAALAVAFFHGDAAQRRLAAEGLAHIGSEAALSLLHRGLSDPDPDVRRAVSFGLATQGLPFDGWLGALGVETDPQVSGAMLADLGFALTARRAGPLLRALDADDAALLTGACTGVARMLERDPAASEATVIRLFELARAPDASVRRVCRNALTRLPPTAVAPLADRVLRHASEALSTSAPEDQVDWVTLLARLGSAAIPALQQAAGSDHVSVAVEAVERLASLRGLPLSAWRQAVDPRLERFAAQRGSASDPVVLRAAFRAAPLLGDSAELVAWLEAAQTQVTTSDGGLTPVEAADLRCAAALAIDRVREWPSRVIQCAASALAEWVPQVSALDVLAHAEGEDALRLVHYRRLWGQGDWHVKHAVQRGLHGIDPAVALPLLLEGLSHDHREVQAAAVETLAIFAPRLRTTGQALPQPIIETLRTAFQTFHVQSHVRGLRAFLSVVRMARLRSELGPVTVLARSGMPTVAHDARALLEEWGHPLPTEPSDPVPTPITRDELATQPATLRLDGGTGPIALTFDPALAKVAASRLIHWLTTARTPIEVAEVRPARHLLLSPSDGIAPGPWRSEETSHPLARGAIVLQPRERDALHGSLLILLAPAPELEGRATHVGRVTEGLEHLERAVLGQRLAPTP